MGLHRSAPVGRGLGCGCWGGVRRVDGVAGGSREMGWSGGS